MIQQGIVEKGDDPVSDRSPPRFLAKMDCMLEKVGPETLNRIFKLKLHQRTNEAHRSR